MSIPFAKDGDIIEKVNDSFSGALTLKIIRNKEKYFFKLYNNKEGEIARIKDICNTYSSVISPSIHVIDCGVTTSNRVWFVFNWVEGLALNKLYNAHHDFYKYGYNLGKIYKKINENKKKDESEFNLQEALKIKENFNTLYAKEKLFYLNFSKDNLIKINNAFLEYLPIFNELEKEYIHGDFHPKNVMIDNNDNLVLIDIDSFRYDYFIYNFRWSIISIYKYKENKDFFRGFVKGRYEDDIPKSINKQLIYILIFKFFEQMVSYYKSDRLDQIEQQIGQYNTIFSQLDLSGNTCILDDN